MTSIGYEPGAIIFSPASLRHSAPVVDLGAVQHRLSPDEFKNFWDRIKAIADIYYKRQKIFIIMFIFLFILFPIAGLISAMSYGYYAPFLIPPLFIGFVGCMVGLALTQMTMVKKIKLLLEQENHEIWNSKGLYWQYVNVHANVGHKRRMVTYLELRVLPSAMGYHAPGQFQSPYQGVLPNPYMQQQVNYSPQMELSK